jgi:hypothetical protein
LIRDSETDASRADEGCAAAGLSCWVCHASVTCRGRIAKEAFHADQKQMHAKHADSSLPLAPPALAGQFVEWR